MEREPLLMVPPPPTSRAHDGPPQSSLPKTSWAAGKPLVRLALPQRETRKTDPNPLMAKRVPTTLIAPLGSNVRLAGTHCELDEGLWVRSCSPGELQSLVYGLAHELCLDDLLSISQSDALLQLEFDAPELPADRACKADEERFCDFDQTVEATLVLVRRAVVALALAKRFEPGMNTVLVFQGPMHDPTAGFVRRLGLRQSANPFSEVLTDADLRFARSIYLRLSGLSTAGNAVFPDLAVPMRLFWEAQAMGDLAAVLACQTAFLGGFLFTGEVRPEHGTGGRVARLLGETPQAGA